MWLLIFNSHLDSKRQQVVQFNISPIFLRVSKMTKSSSWGMRVGNWSITSISASSTDLKEFKLHTDYSGIWEKRKPFVIVGQAADLLFEPKFWSVLAITPEGCSWRQAQVLTAKLMAKLLAQLRLVRLQSTNGKHSAALAVNDWLASGKNAAALAIQNQKVLMLCKMSKNNA